MGKKPKVLAVVPGFIPSVWICIIKPLNSLKLKGDIDFSITLDKFATGFEIKRADAVVFCRNAEPHYLKPLDLARLYLKPIIYDIDDNFFDIPEEWELGKYYRAPERVAALERYLSEADLVRVYSNPMFGHARRYNESVEKIFAPIDLALIPPRPKKRGGRVKIVYGTSRMNDTCSQIFAPALNRCLGEYGNRVSFTLWGFKQENFPVHPSVRRLEVIRNYDDFMRAFSAEAFDIGIAPLFNDTFHRSKTNNKFREYGACGIAGIYSNVDVYSDCVEDGKTGLLIENSEEAWYGALKKLLLEEELRNRIGAGARKFVEDNYSQERYKEKWLEHIKTVLPMGGVRREKSGGKGEIDSGEGFMERLKSRFEKGALILKDKNHRSYAKTLAEIYMRDFKELVKLRLKLSRGR